MNEDFEARLAAYVEGCEAITNEDAGESHPFRYEYEVNNRGRRYVKLIRWAVFKATGEKTEQGVHSFVEKATGRVLKAASWKAPADGARGNIFDIHYGLGRMGPNGPAYNRLYSIDLGARTACIYIGAN